MSFGDIFGKSWKEYWGNFKSISSTMALFYAFPAFLGSVFMAWFTYFHLGLSWEDLIQLGGKLPASYYLVNGIVGVVVLLFSLVVYAGIISVFLKKGKKVSFSSIVSEGSRLYGNYLAFVIVSSVFIIGLFALLIIPGIIFAVYWIFAVFVLIDKNKGILESLGGSMKIVKGRWWRVFGNLLLLILIFLGIAICVGLLWAIISIPLGLFDFFVGGTGDQLALAVFDVLGEIVNIILNIFFVPFIILFFKNFYLELRG
jgi:hypothetical protein